jgi:hyperosmotically inducible protein
MKTKAFHWAAAVWLAGAGLVVTGCQQPGEPDAVEVSKDAEGDTHLKIDGDQVDENLKKTEEQVQAGAREVKEGARQVGQAIERGAERVEAEVGPVVRDVLDDATITTRIKAKLVADPEVNAFHIDVDTIDGQVTLTGRVATELQRTEAGQLATRTEGVSVVNNLIQVAGQQALPPPAAGSGQ